MAVVTDEVTEESSEDRAFRTEAQSWLADHAPAAAASGDAHAWQRELVEGRFAAITWPTEYGGRDGTPRQQAIFFEEMNRYEVPWGAVSGIGMGMVAPTILVHGTDAQKEQFLPPMARADHQWCQLFSEPGAGSDLAGLTTRAERDGDEWVVNGQKVWSTYAHVADYGMLLARTDVDQPKHRGITYFLFDMHQPGVEVRPLRQMTGDAEFNEVFLTDARVPHANVLGQVNGGWSVAMTTLANERAMMGGGTAGRRPRADDDANAAFLMGARGLIDLARDRERTHDPLVRQGLADAWMREEIMRYLVLRIQAAARLGRDASAQASIMKLYSAKQTKRVAELALTLEGPYGALAAADAPAGGAWQRTFLFAPALRIAGGSDQVQRNVMGERVLQLPAEPRADKGIPFRDVPKNPSRA
jgi:alkylation response protein AidB-like acyl-CoA dehydrogenase